VISNIPPVSIIVITNIQWALRLSWLENACSCPLFLSGDFDL